LEDVARFTCADCGSTMNRDDHVCPYCGSSNRLIDHELDEAVAIESSTRLKARHGQPGEVAPHLKVYDDVLWNHDRQRKERRRMVTDLERDYYCQEWFDLETGERVWWKEGRLSDPDVHGKSARRRVEADTERPSDP